MNGHIAVVWGSVIEDLDISKNEESVKTIFGASQRTGRPCPCKGC